MTDVFSDPKPEESSSQNPSAQTAEDTLSKLVGEGKKFKSVEDLARGKLEADAFIETLKSEQMEMRKTLKEFEEQLRKVQTVGDVLSEKKTEDREGNQTGQITADEIVKLVDERLTKQTSAQKAAANREKANAHVLKHFNGDAAKAREYVTKEAERLGMTPERLGELSSQSPEAFLRLVGIGQTKPNPGVGFDSIVNPDATENSSQVRDAKYYNDLRKKLGARFYEQDIQQQRMRDRQALGDRFFK